jgi:tRNA(Ile)-lysidine synthase
MPRSKKCSVPAATEPGPVSPVEAGRLFSSVEQCRCLLLAVSGGSDSMALMVLADRWARETGWPGRLHVAVVDHGLRAEAADETAFVEREAKRLGLKAHVLKWSGPYPKTGIPAAAREARYGLLCGLARTLDAAVLTAHTQDDQAETVVMRLARGSGVDGLSAMETGTVRDGVTLVRPMLPVSRQRLRDTLRQAGMTWIDDPTNENTAHERVRVRKALDVLDGLGVSREAVALTAARLGRARSALEVAQAGLMQVAVRIKANSYAEIDLECWVHGPAELQVRVIMTTGLDVRRGAGDQPVGCRARARLDAGGSGPGNDVCRLPVCPAQTRDRRGAGGCTDWLSWRTVVRGHDLGQSLRDCCAGWPAASNGGARQGLHRSGKAARHSRFRLARAAGRML